MKLTLAAILFFATLYTLSAGADAWLYGYGYGFPYWGYGGLWNRWAWYRPFYAASWWRRAVEDVRPRVECTYLEGQSLLSCSSPNGTVDCPAFGLFEKFGSDFFRFYGISAFPVGNLSVPSSVYYPLYPQISEPRGWLNTSFVDPVLGKAFDYSLYLGKEFRSHGFRIEDELCWGRLVRLFSSLGFNDSILIGTGEVRQVEILGGVLFS